MSDLASSGRYVVEMARGESGDHDPLQDVLDACPKGHRLHSITPFASGGGYTLSFIVVFEREPASLEAPPAKTTKQK